MMQYEYFGCLCYLVFVLDMLIKKKKKKGGKDQKIIHHLQDHIKWLQEYIKFPNTMQVHSNMNKWEGHLGSHKWSKKNVG